MSEWFNKLVKEAEQHPAYHLESVYLQFSEAVLEQLEKKEMTKEKLEEATGFLKEAVYMEVREGDINLEGMIATAMALEMNLKIELVER